MHFRHVQKCSVVMVLGGYWSGGVMTVVVVCCITGSVLYNVVGVGMMVVVLCCWHCRYDEETLVGCSNEGGWLLELSTE